MKIQANHMLDLDRLYGAYMFAETEIGAGWSADRSHEALMAFIARCKEIGVDQTAGRRLAYIATANWDELRARGEEVIDVDF